MEVVSLGLLSVVCFETGIQIYNNFNKYLVDFLIFSIFDLMIVEFYFIIIFLIYYDYLYLSTYIILNI